MEMRLVLFAFLVTCSVWAVYGRSLEIKIDDQEEVEMEISKEARKLPGLCWACQWALNKVKKTLKRNNTEDYVKKKLTAVCSQMGLLKSLCERFVRKNLEVLIEELTTTDDVKTICVNAKACRKMNLQQIIFYNSNEMYDFP
ncbi:antimicrobial peptide NK-lysin [Echeneis naucrates]|uniref:Antimicrobial peptide NK-lysin-like n=1 Tax=Echeneis naucrates TaxID=173247 RepID=A0A665UW46_ECHNA|nr:antimicrobial peptide NK-lysin-like [Echeneis naucrates]